MSIKLPGYCQGRPEDRIRKAWAMRFGLSEKSMRLHLTDAMCTQLSYCKDDEARRLLLGVKP